MTQRRAKCIGSREPMSITRLKQQTLKDQSNIGTSVMPAKKLQYAKMAEVILNARLIKYFTALTELLGHYTTANGLISKLIISMETH